MEQDHAHDDPIVVYRATAILTAAFALALLFVPFEWIVSGAKSQGFVAAIADSVGEWGARLLFAVPCAYLATLAMRKGWGEED